MMKFNVVMMDVVKIALLLLCCCHLVGSYSLQATSSGGRWSTRHRHTTTTASSSTNKRNTMQPWLAMMRTVHRMQAQPSATTATDAKQATVIEDDVEEIARLQALINKNQDAEDNEEEEEEDVEDEDTEENTKIAELISRTIEEDRARRAQQQQDAIPLPTTTSSTATTSTSSISSDGMEGSSGSSPEDQQFAQLLQQAINSAANKKSSSADEDYTDKVFSKVGEGENISSTDLRAILGNSLVTIAETMEVDLVAEINDNPTIKEDFQSILQRSYQQANRQIKDAEKQSEVLFMNIAELQKKIQEDETNFTEDKKEELDDIFKQQIKLQEELNQSAQQLQTSQRIYDEWIPNTLAKGDIYTLLATFSLRSKLEQFAFIGGTTMFFKFTTDLNYFLLHMSDSIPTDYVFLGTEFVLAMLAWNYFGLFRALKNTKTF